MIETSISREVGSLGFEEAMSELEKIARQLEEGRIPLQEAVNFYERGSKLKQRCEILLDEARLKIDEIVQSEQGGITAQPSSLEEFHQPNND